MLQKILIFLCLIAVSSQAATFSVSPASIPANYPGLITISIIGLNTGETVRLEKSIDLNGNGQVDSGEPIRESFLLTDGQAASIGGQRNRNIPGDDDGAANGEIHASILFAAQSEINVSSGAFLWRLSSPQNRFAATTAALTVTDAPSAQTVSGTVLVGTAAASHAFVGILSAQGKFVTGTKADANGHFSIHIPIGTFKVIAFTPRAFGNFNSAPGFSVAANGTAQVTVNLTPGTHAISGKA